jgi:hypothetical protein
LLELHRAQLTQAVFEYAQARTFKRADFELLPEGVVRLSPPLARNIALTLKEITFKEYVAGIKRVAAWILSHQKAFQSIGRREWHG